MRTISTEEIEQGHVAAQDIHSSSGNVLVLKGTPLSPALGKRLKNWGISNIYIEGEDEQTNDFYACEISDDKTRERIIEKFSGTLDIPRMRKIFEAVCVHKKQIQGGA